MWCYFGKVLLHWVTRTQYRNTIPQLVNDWRVKGKIYYSFQRNQLFTGSIASCLDFYGTTQSHFSAVWLYSFPSTIHIIIMVDKSFRRSNRIIVNTMFHASAKATINVIRYKTTMLWCLFGGGVYFDTFLEAYDVPSQLESFRFSLFRLRNWMASLPTYQRTWISLIYHLDLDLDILWLFIFSIAERQFFVKHTFYEKNRKSHRSISRENCNCLGFLVISSSSILRCLLLLAERWSGSSSWSVTSSVSLWQSSLWWLLRSMFSSFSVTAVARAKSSTSNAQDFFILQLILDFTISWKP